MANYYTSDVLKKMLADVQTRRQQEAKQEPLAFQNFQPKKLDFQPVKNDFYTDIMNAIMESDNERTNISFVKSQNKRNYQDFLDAQKSLQSAQSMAQQQGSLNYTGGTRRWAGGWGKDKIPQVWDIPKLDPHAGIVQVNWRGHNFGVNSQVAPIFVAFLDNLWQTGYRPKSIGGYANRNIAGTNTPSLHSYGFAIDIDPGSNPVTWNGQIITSLPPGIGALAARYGLAWGGDWKGSKKDTMHFSVPYGGTK